MNIELVMYSSDTYLPWNILKTLVKESIDIHIKLIVNLLIKEFSLNYVIHVQRIFDNFNITAH